MSTEVTVNNYRITCVPGTVLHALCIPNPQNSSTSIFSILTDEEAETEVR